MTLYRVNTETIETLWALANAANASVEIEAVNLTHEALDVLGTFLQQHGGAVKQLHASLHFPQTPYHHNWFGLDFAATCPALETVRLERIDINESLLLHPRLMNLRCEQMFIQSAAIVSPSETLETIFLYAVNWQNAQSLAFHQHPRLKRFDYSLDEDDAESCPNRLLFEGCPELAELYLNVSGSWSVELVGDFPRLAQFGASSGRFGNHEIKLSQVGDDSHPRLIALRDGLGPLKGRVFAFAGEFKHFNLEKAEQAVQILGGTVVATLEDDRITDIIVSQAGYAQFEDALYPDANIYTELDFKDEISGWY